MVRRIRRKVRSQAQKGARHSCRRILEVPHEGIVVPVFDPDVGVSTLLGAEFVVVRTCHAARVCLDEISFEKEARVRLEAEIDALPKDCSGDEAPFVRVQCSSGIQIALWLLTLPSASLLAPVMGAGEGNGIVSLLVPHLQMPEPRSAIISYMREDTESKPHVHGGVVLGQYSFVVDVVYDKKCARTVVLGHCDTIPEGRLAMRQYLGVVERSSLPEVSSKVSVRFTGDIARMIVMAYWHSEGDAPVVMQERH